MTFFSTPAHGTSVMLRTNGGAVGTENGRDEPGDAAARPVNPPRFVRRSQQRARHWRHPHPQCVVRGHLWHRAASRRRRSHSACRCSLRSVRSDGRLTERWKSVRRHCVRESIPNLVFDRNRLLLRTRVFGRDVLTTLDTGATTTDLNANFVEGVSAGGSGREKGEGPTSPVSAAHRHSTRSRFQK